MTGIPSINSTGSDTAASTRINDRATLAISKALQAKKREAEGMVKLIEQASASGKGQHVDYRA